ncbi:hypothetical protein C475_06855 [Halosimplex carlsbadense 2-9-1]|uniref:Lipoprotein n=1 Tax=Halosimplex carlsbadense 2-9-1 TaxID=797114 RepID=M0D0F5_9EURY|nr:hypothetical protein [Halosimplex carlsbadense]ELZ27619.1 hypothetical protein C475_06855 [Halosimplex carlsbadense 2-9-1]
MQRRTLLRGLGAAGTLALTGCLSDGSGGQPTDTGGSDDTDEPTDTPSDGPANTDRSTATDRTDDTVTEPDPDGTDGPSATPSESPVDTASETPDSEPSATPSGVADSSLAVTDRGCGTETDDASVAFDENGGTVTVTGTTWGIDTCHTAVLSYVRLDDGALTVAVGSESESGTDTACGQCITEIDYEATVALDSALPREVVVVHAHGGEDTRVTSATR